MRSVRRGSALDDRQQAAIGQARQGLQALVAGAGLGEGARAAGSACPWARSCRGRRRRPDPPSRRPPARRRRPPNTSASASSGRPPAVGQAPLGGDRQRRSPGRCRCIGPARPRTGCSGRSGDRSRAPSSLAAEMPPKSGSPERSSNAPTSSSSPMRAGRGVSAVNSGARDDVLCARCRPRRAAERREQGQGEDRPRCDAGWRPVDKRAARLGRGGPPFRSTGDDRRAA